MNAILELTQDEEGFALALLRLNQDDRIPKFLEALDGSLVFTIPTAHIPNVVNALVDSTDLFPAGEKSELTFDIPMRIHRILRQLLRRFADNKQRFAIFRDAITKSMNSIYIIVHELDVQSHEHNENEDTYVPGPERDFSTLQLDTLKKMAVEKIKTWAELGRLVEHPKLIQILYAWRNWGDEESCKKYVKSIVATDRGCLYFLGSALKEPVMEAMNKEETNPAWRGYLKNIADFISPEELLPHTVALFADDYFVKLREDEQLTLMIFLSLVKPDTVKVFPNTVS
jgi:predicted KAP-like P-loop ATPase